MPTTPDTFPSLFAGYTVLWALIALYMFSLGSRLRRIESGLKQENAGDPKVPKA